MKAIVFGCGLVGGEIVRDLAANGEFEVTAVDLSASALEPLNSLPHVTTLQENLGWPERVSELAREHDIAVVAVPGFMGHQTLEAVIETGVNAVDISFAPEDPAALNELAESKGVIALTDCGVAPGLSHALVGRAVSQLDEVASVAMYVGGLPANPEPPWEYKAVFSPADVLEEYTRPARLKRDGIIVLVDALSQVEELEFPEIGVLEAFATDGLRSLLTTIDAPEMVEKTLRYPGHAAKMRTLRDAGLFSKDAVEVGGIAVRPLEVTSRLLFPQWKLREEDEDLTVMRVIVRGKKSGAEKEFRYELLDRYDRGKGVTSMARTTGYVATAAVRLIRDGVFTRKGVSPPEHLGMDDACFTALMGHLRERGVVVSGV